MSSLLMLLLCHICGLRKAQPNSFLLPHPGSHHLTEVFVTLRSVSTVVVLQKFTDPNFFCKGIIPLLTINWILYVEVHVFLYLEIILYL